MHICISCLSKSKLLFLSTASKREFAKKFIHNWVIDDRYATQSFSNDGRSTDDRND